MNAFQKVFPGGSRRPRVRGAAACCARLSGFPRAQRAGSATADRYGSTVLRAQQRAAGGLRQGNEAARMELERHAESRTQRTGSIGLSCSNANRHAAKPSRVVCALLAGAGLVVGDGHQAGKLSARSIPYLFDKNAALTPSDGANGGPIAPAHGSSALPSAPSDGAIREVFPHPSTPSGGDYLDVAICTDETAQERSLA